MYGITRRAFGNKIARTATGVFYLVNERRLPLTAYTAGPESTGKYPGHPEYRRTASGLIAEAGRTVASNRFPLDTEVYIPLLDERTEKFQQLPLILQQFFSRYENMGQFVVEDRGGYGIDIYFGDHLPIILDINGDETSYSSLRLAILFGIRYEDVHVSLGN